MFSLRVAILLVLALSTRIENSAVNGYVPFNLDSPPVAESTTQETDCDSETSSTPVIETTTAATYPVVLNKPRSVSSAQLSLVQENSTTATASCLCKACKPERGYFIKHFRQYNYYYPNGQKVSVPMPGPDPIVADDFFPNFDLPVTSTISMVGNNGRMTLKAGNKPTVRYNLPGVASYVPNNGFNYVYDQLSSGLAQSVPVYGSSPTYAQSTYDQKSVNVEESTSSDESSAEQANEQVTQDRESGSSSSSSSSDDSVTSDIVTYRSPPNANRQTIMTVKNDKGRGFRSQQVSMSSRMQSPSVKSSGTGYESQEQSSSSSSMQSQSSGYESASSSAEDTNQSRMTSFGYNPYFQSQQFGVPPMLQPQPQLPSLSGYQSSFDFLGGGASAASQIYQQNPFQYFKPMRGSVNVPGPSPASSPISSYFDYPSFSPPSYSVIL